MDSEIIPSVDEWDERRAKTSSGKRKHNGGSSEPKTAPDHRGDPANDVSNSARASTSHGRHASSRMAGSEASGMVDAASASPASADLSGDIQPRVHSRRRSRAAPVDFIDRGLRPKKSLDNELSLEEFSSNTRKELNYFDAEVLTGFIEADPRQAQDSSAQRSGPEMGLRRGSSFKEISSLGSSRHIALRTQRNTVTGSVDIVDSAPRDRGLQRGGSFKGSSVSRSLRRDESFKGSLQEVDETKPSMRRVGSFRTGPAQGSSSSKESQRIAHMSALNKQTSWIRASPVPSPEQSPQSTNPGFIARWKESIFGGDASQKVIPAEEEASTGLSESKLRGPSDRKLSRDSIATKQLDDSDYAGSNRPRDNVAPSERLKYVMKRGPENDNSDGGSRGQLLSNNTPESSVIYPKPASEKMSILRFKLDEGQKALEKRLLVSNAEAMHKFPGPHPETLNTTRKKKPSLFSLMDGMSLVTHNMVIGSRYDAEDLGALRKLGISYVLNMTDRIPNYFPDVLIYHKIEIQDKPSTQLEGAFRSAAGFLQHVEANKGRVLVHCVAGVSRSVSIFLMYMMAFYRIKLSALWNHVYYIRPYIGPNEGFCLQLAHFEVEHLGALSVGKHTSKHWDFYGLNSIIGTLPKDYSGSTAADAPPECCIIQ